MRTCMDSNRPERMTAIIAHELLRYNINIAALSETRFAGTGDQVEISAGYTFFWSGKAADEPRKASVGFAIHTDLIPKLETIPKGISNRLMTMRIPLAGNTHFTLISAYTPVMTYPEEDKEQFYLVLQDTLHSVPRNDKLLLMGDQCMHWWELGSMTHRHRSPWPGARKCIWASAADSLFRVCLTITNTLFKQPEIHTVTWMHPHSKHWHLIDYVITRRPE